MKIVFVNSPCIRSQNSCAANDFAIEGFVFEHKYRKIKGAWRAFRLFRKWFGLGKGVRYGVRAGSRWPWTMDTPHGGAPYPFFMGYAASYLQHHGYEVDLIDAVAEEEYSYESFLQDVCSRRPDIVVVECSTPTIDIDLWIANKISSFAEVALAGPHINDETGPQIQAANPNIRYLLKGEYILSALEMARTRREGLYEREVVRDLDSIPFPFRDYSAATQYYEPTMPTPRPMLQIYGSKGCPFKCTFCVWPQVMYAGAVAVRKPEKIAEEIRDAVSKHGYKSILFDDDTFNVGTERVSNLCDHLGEIGLPWTMMGRLDCSPDWLLDKMVDSGCVGMRFGIETFDLAVLKHVKKGIERMDFRGALEHLATKYPKLMLHVTMMQNMPGQSEEVHQEDMHILHHMGFSEDNIYRSYQLSRCAPFPGTEMYRELAAKHGEQALKQYELYDGSSETVASKLGAGQ